MMLVPNPNDVLCGRGGATNTHRGNIVWRELVLDLAADYTHLGRGNHRRKRLLVDQVIDAVQAHGGRFLRPGQSGWIQLNRAQARKKTSQKFTDYKIDARKDAQDMIRQYSHEYHFPPVAPPSVEYDDDDISVLGEDDGTDWGKLEAAPSPLETPSYATTVSPSNFSQKSSVLDLDGILETLPADWW